MSLPNERTYLSDKKRGPYEGPHYTSDAAMSGEYSRDSNQYALHRLIIEYNNTNEDNFYGQKFRENLAHQIARAAAALREEIKNGYQDNPELPSSASSLKLADAIIRKIQTQQPTTVSTIDPEGM